MRSAGLDADTAGTPCGVVLYLGGRCGPSGGAEPPLEALRRYALSQGWTALEERVEVPSGEDGTVWRQLTDDLSTGRLKVDVVLVDSVADAFPSTAAFVAAVERLDILGVALRSRRERWVGATLRPETERATTGVNVDLQGALVRFLERQSNAFDKAERETAAQARRDAVRADIGRLAGHLLVLIAYAAALSIINRSSLLEALLDPAALSRNLHDAVALVGAIPALLLAAIASLMVFAFRSGSLRSQTDVAGVLFVGALVLTLLGLSAAASAGVLGALEAVPGFVGVLVVMDEFTWWLVQTRQTAVSAGAGRRVPASHVTLRFGHAMEHELQRARDRTLPTEGGMLPVVFVAAPVVTSLIVIAGVSVEVGSGSTPVWLFVITRLALVALVVWAVWACSVTPRSARIPIWSMVAWGAFCQALFRLGPVSGVFALAVFVLLLFSVVSVTPGVAGHRRMRKRQRRPEPADSVSMRAADGTSPRGEALPPALPGG